MDLVVKTGNSVAKFADNRAASIVRGSSQPEYMAPVVRFDDCRVSYSILNHDARRQLAAELNHLVTVAFWEVPTDRTRISQQQSDLHEAVGLLAKDLVETLLVRQDTIQYHLNDLINQLQEIIVYGNDSKNSIWELMIARSLKKLIKNMNSATNRSVTLTEFPKLAQIAEVDADSLRFEIDYSPLEAISLGDVSENVRKVFGAKELDAGEDAMKEEDETRHKMRVDLLQNLSPDALAAFNATELLIIEVTPLATTPEDEYFMEQIEQDYYPHIFDALKQFEGSAIDFENKEVAVVESIKQFKIIQLGLQKIIDNAVARKLASIKSQTDFLSNKVLGEKALSLSPKESEEEVETVLAEAQKIREGLYQKHVAPVLEQNKNDYDAALKKNREDYDAKLVENRENYEKLSTEQKSDFDKQVAFYKDENVQQQATYYERLAEQKADFDTEIAADKKSLVAGYKKELALRTDGFKKSVRALKDSHSTEIADLKEDNARVLEKYHDLLAETKKTSREGLIEGYEEVINQYRLDFEQQDELFADEILRLEKESANKLSSYKAQIDDLKCEIDQLEALATSFIGKDALPPINKGANRTSVKADDYDPWEGSTLKAILSARAKRQEPKVEQDINEAKQLLESRERQTATQWDNGQRLLTSDEMRDESYWSESYFEEM